LQAEWKVQVRAWSQGHTPLRCVWLFNAGYLLLRLPENMNSEEARGKKPLSDPQQFGSDNRHYQK
jgi:hypothetical protein